MTLPCHCGSGSHYRDCCEPFVLLKAYPPTAEALMRSRYSAFCERQVDYLLHTRHPSHRAQDSRESLRASQDTTQWRSLRILSATQRGDEGEAEFVAFYTSPTESPGQIRERSQFRRDGRQWYYLTGTHLPPLKLQRNDPCWCGSGKKIKKCCGGA